MSDSQLAPDQMAIGGELVAARCEITWVNPQRIEAGEFIVTPRAPPTDLAKEFAALQLILADLSFALDCLVEADKLGVPDDSSVMSKSLIFSGVVAYSRCFKGGVRAIRLKSDDLRTACDAFDVEIHDYLIDLRDKHIAHSVNGFEDCEVTNILIGHPGKWRDGGGLGVIMKKTVGASRAHVQRAIKQVVAVKDHCSREIVGRRQPLYAEFKMAFDPAGSWELAPLLKANDRANVSRRR